VYMMKVLVDVLVTIAKMVSDEVSQHIPVVLGINFLLEENNAVKKYCVLDPDHYSKSDFSVCISKSKCCSIFTQIKSKIRNTDGPLKVFKNNFLSRLLFVRKLMMFKNLADLRYFLY
jgi:hypothetical protein